ncbi:MAG TPA: hypothetical protein VMY42_22900 [Thermoguttaceae bacterium]|nr:hypothetical protein [Thermoguttaceae bacterium]
MTLGLLAATGPVCYGLGLWAASAADGHALGEAACFDPTVEHHFAPARVIAAVAMAVGASLLVVVVPWILGMLAISRWETKRATAGAWSLAVNSATLVLVCLVLRNTVGIGRASFLIGWLAWTVALLLVAGKTADPLGDVRSALRRWGPGLAIGLAAVAAGVGLFHREHFVQCFNGDGTEQFEVTRSLRQHFLPYWEIEATERFGTYMANPTVICSYWSLPWQLLLGGGELATRLPCWIWWLGIFAVSLRMVQGDRERGSWLPAVPLALGLLMTSVWYTFYVGYYPYMADPASPGVLDALFTLLLLLALDCLRHGDCAGWVVMMLLASLLFYAGPVVFLLTAAAAWLWRPVARGQLYRATLCGTLALGAIVLGYLVVGWSEGSLPGWWSTLQRENVEKYFAPATPWRTNLRYAVLFLVGCGGIPVLGLLRGFWRNGTRDETAWERTVATVAVAYLLIVLGSGHKNLHYLGPLLPLPLVLWLKSARGAAAAIGPKGVGPLLATASLAACLFLCRPNERPMFTLNRELGTATTFQTDSYEEACAWAKMIYPMYDRGLISWQVGHHTWLGYSQLAAQAAEKRPLVIAQGPPPSAEYQVLFESTGGARLYCRDLRWAHWLKAERRLPGPERFPPLFRPIAPAGQEPP